ncbi:MAG: hypothetical protein JO186_10230 [Actinobacteria bacterium]|nr:hypothetical protein [Actinomycetota bacterium]MBV8396653.1 hypothetical protein [Actinomycetota bacterium]MBV8598866.1 hypothetical protein [Actinomycetota bacterium]
MRGVLAAAVVAAVACGSAYAASVPSRRACVDAWNTTANPALRARVAAEHPKAAYVDSAVVIGVDWVIGGKTRSASRTGCGIQFILANGHTLSVSGPWDGSTVSAWTHPVPSARVVPVPRNASVQPDGTVAIR